MASVRELAAQRREKARREAERRLTQRVDGVRIVPRWMNVLRPLARIHRDEAGTSRQEPTR